MNYDKYLEYKNEEQEYNIRQTFKFSFNNIIENKIVAQSLENFKNNSNKLILLIRRKDFEDKNQWYNFTNWHKKGVNPVQNITDFSDLIADDDSKLIDNLSSLTNQDLLSTFEPNMGDNGEDFDDSLINPNYYNLMNAYSNSCNVPENGIYQFSFDNEIKENNWNQLKH